MPTEAHVLDLQFQPVSGPAWTTYVNLHAWASIFIIGWVQAPCRGVTCRYAWGGPLGVMGRPVAKQGWGCFKWGGGLRYTPPPRTEAARVSPRRIPPFNGPGRPAAAALLCAPKTGTGTPVGLRGRTVPAEGFISMYRRYSI